ncbi:hypothetical protein LAZ67_X000710 [Cordylochernes scorpioides]|uniref:Reverse transcriptase domain-containing protein n=1 Tax=Cordylochernes scorpioides TaxID=51811 RepID=A0ABY6LTX5_9ARAC|nr:hypothetical protein LAZ67_X000710 [Cordylochernes scorpioides]
MLQWPPILAKVQPHQRVQVTKRGSGICWPGIALPLKPPRMDQPQDPVYPQAPEELPMASAGSSLSNVGTTFTFGTSMFSKRSTMWFLPARSAYRDSKTCGPAEAANTTRVAQRLNNGPKRVHHLRGERRHLEIKPPALEELEHSSQLAAQEPTSSETPTGLPVELDQQNAPPTSNLSAEATPFRPEAHGTKNADEEAQRGTSSEETYSTSPPASNPATSSESPLIQQEEAADNLRLPVVDIDPPNEQTLRVLDNEDLQAAASSNDSALLPQDAPVTPPPASKPGGTPSWKESSSILLHKKGDAEDLGNWRPMALGNTTAKLYTAVLADTLRRWAATMGQLSKAQKGFMEFEECLEHNFVLQSAIEETKRTSRQACFAWLDLENAFCSVPHEHIFNVLNAFGVLEETPLGFTSPIPFKRGVKQGCLGSPTLFNVAIEVKVCTLASMAKDHGVHLLGHYVSVLAYADDLLMMAKNKEFLQALLDSTSDLAGKIGLHFKGPKCANLHLDCMKKSTTLPTTFCIHEQPIPTMREEDMYCHLGVPTGFNKSRNPEEAIKEIKEDVEKIHNSLLAPWQKIDATKTFVYPRLNFILRGSPIQKTSFREAEQEWCRLVIGQTWPRSNTFRLLMSPDSETSTLAKSLLKRITERKLGWPALEEDLEAYLLRKLDCDFARDGGDITLPGMMPETLPDTSQKGSVFSLSTTQRWDTLLLSSPTPARHQKKSASLQSLGAKSWQDFGRTPT